MLIHVRHAQADPAAPGFVKDMNTISRVKVEIVRSTEKAHLVKDSAGRECWVQKRWLREDSTVSGETFNRGACRKQEIADAAKAEREEAAAFRNGLHALRIEGESASGKAVSVKATWSVAANDDFGGSRFVWLPKSQIKDGCAPGWLLIAKAGELAADVIGGQNHFSIVVESIGGVAIGAHVVPEGWAR